MQCFTFNVFLTKNESNTAGFCICLPRNTQGLASPGLRHLNSCLSRSVQQRTLAPPPTPTPFSSLAFSGPSTITISSTAKQKNHISFSLTDLSLLPHFSVSCLTGRNTSSPQFHSRYQAGCHTSWPHASSLFLSHLGTDVSFVEF